MIRTTPTQRFALQRLSIWLLLQVLMASGLSLALGNTSGTRLLWWLASCASARLLFVQLKAQSNLRLAELFGLTYCAFAGAFLGSHLKSWICVLFSLFC